MTSCPPSATRNGPVLIGLGSTIAALAAVIFTQVPPFLGALMCMGAYFCTWLGLSWREVQTRPIRSFSLERCRLKFIALWISIGGVCFVHWLLGIYPAGDLALPLLALTVLLPGLLVLSPFYIALVDRTSPEPEDEYYAFGRLLTGQTFDASLVREHGLTWVIKGFFWPIMFTYLVRLIADLQHYSDFSMSLSLIQWVTLFVTAGELVIVCVGYLSTLKLLGSNVRSANPFLAGWLVTLACYAPFNEIMSGKILNGNDKVGWMEWFGPYPLIAWPWAALIVASFAVWLWATASFGLRWSNLTHRGIITSGPYRYTKHPDYIAKSCFFWLVQVPFLSHAGVAAAIKSCMLLALLNLIYYLRAKYEEKHLMADPIYAEYARWIDENGLFRWSVWRRPQPA